MNARFRSQECFDSREKIPKLQLQLKHKFALPLLMGLEALLANQNILAPKGPSNADDSRNTCRAPASLEPTRKGFLAHRLNLKELETSRKPMCTLAPSGGQFSGRPTWLGGLPRKSSF